MKLKILLICLCYILVTGTSCRNTRVTRTDTPTSGVAEIVGDDCFGNVIQEEVDVFEALNQKASIIPILTDESEALQLLLDDSVRLAIMARDLTDAEKESIHSRNQELIPRSQRIAIDGIALVVNPETKLERMSVPTLRKLMTGQTMTWRQIDPSLPDEPVAVIFDSPGSSTARFIRDSICGGKTLAGNLYAQQNNLSVIDYVTKNRHTLGILDVNWISNPNDSLQLSFNKAIKVLAVSRTEPATDENSFLPVPAYLYMRSYPLTRDVYAVLTDLRGTLPAGFMNFVAGDRGQRIVLKSGLVPATRPIRTVEIKEKF